MSLKDPSKNVLADVKPGDRLAMVSREGAPLDILVVSERKPRSIVTKRGDGGYEEGWTFAGASTTKDEPCRVRLATPRDEAVVAAIKALRDAKNAEYSAKVAANRAVAAVKEHRAKLAEWERAVVDSKDAHETAVPQFAARHPTLPASGTARHRL